jgi:hypothetical protein
MSLAYRDEMMQAARMVPGTDAGRFELSSRVQAEAFIPPASLFATGVLEWRDRGGGGDDGTGATEPKRQLPEEVASAGATQGRAKKLRRRNTKWEWPLHWQQLCSAKRLFPAVCNAVHVALDGVRTKALGEINQYCCSIPRLFLALWLPVQAGLVIRLFKALALSVTSMMLVSGPRPAGHVLNIDLSALAHGLGQDG